MTCFIALQCLILFEVTKTIKIPKYETVFLTDGKSRCIQIYKFCTTNLFFCLVFDDRRSCQIIWQIFTQGRAKPGPADRQSNALSTELGRRSAGQEISEVSLVCFMHHFTCWTLFISRINRAWLYKGHEDSGWQLNVDLVQLVEHWPHDLEVLVSIPSGGNFWQIFFVLPCVKICQVIWQKRLSWKTHVLWLCDWKLFSYLTLTKPMEVNWFSPLSKASHQFLSLKFFSILENWKTYYNYYCNHCNYTRISANTWFLRWNIVFRGLFHTRANNLLQVHNIHYWVSKNIQTWDFLFWSELIFVKGK